MQTLSLLLVVALLCFGHAAESAGKQEPAFPLLLSPLASAATAQDYYPEEASTVCLREKLPAVPACNEIFVDDDNEDGDLDEGGQFQGYYRTDLECCKPPYAARDSIVDTSARVGWCDYTYIYSTAGGVGQPAIQGTFSVVCILQESAEECVSPFCKDMVLSAQGSVYSLEQVVTDDGSEDVNDLCLLGPGVSNRRTKADAVRKHDGKSKLKAGAKKANADRTLYSARAEVLAGPMQVTSVSSGKSYTGWFQSTLYVFEIEPLAGPPPSAARFVRPNEIKLKIFDNEEPKHYSN